MGKYLFPAILILMVGSFAIGWNSGCRHRAISPVEPVKTKVDTLLVRDTIVRNTPVFVHRTRIDSVLVPAPDTVRLQDTLYVYLERERLIWEDSLCTVWASGIRPQIDSVAHYVNERIITVKTERVVKAPSRWGLGVQAGVGASGNGLTPYVGVGISYNLLSW